MNDTRPLHIILSQLTELYNQILTNQNKTLTFTPEIIENINRLSKEIEAMSQFTEMEAARMGITDEMIKNTILGAKPAGNPEIKNLLERSLQLKGQIEGCRNILKEIMKKQKEEHKVNAKKRKDKFKNIGGKEGWIPM